MDDDKLKRALEALLAALDGYDHDLGLDSNIREAMHRAHVALGDPDAIEADRAREKRAISKRDLALFLDTLNIWPREMPPE